MTVAQTAPTVLFSEPGARWRAVAYGPILCLVILLMELSLGSHRQVHWFALAFCAVLLAGFVSLQVVAGRRHVSVELTGTALRQGTQTLPLREIATILPERDEAAWDDEPWQSARALGELAGVPRRRRGIGLTLCDGHTVQAWARDDQRLRSELTTALARLSESDDAESEDAESDGAEPEER